MALTKVTFSMIDTTNLCVEDFGAVGDGVTDDAAALQAAFDYSAANNVAVFLQDKRYYIGSTLQVGGAIIRSLSGNPGGAEPYYLLAPDGSPVIGVTPNTEYYFNKTPAGVAFTFQQMIASTAYGPCIVSDYDGLMLECENGKTINIQGIAIVGYHRATNQVGIATETPAAYLGVRHFPLENVNIIGTGSFGAWFKGGLENTYLTKVQIKYCNSYGVVVDTTAGIDSPVDNLSFTECDFQFNRLSGVYFDEVRKHILFDNCDLSGNGQYQDGIQPNGTYIDPLLGYDRTPPVNVALMAAGVQVLDSAAQNGGFIFNMCFTNCTGELMGVGLWLRSQESIGALQYLRIQNCSFYRSPQFPYSGGNNAAMIFLDVDYLNNALVGENYPQSCDYIAFASGIPPSSGNTVNSNLFLDNSVSSNASASDLTEFLGYRFPGAIGVQGTAAKLYSGAGSPEGVVTAIIGSLYMRINGGAGTSLYVKESGVGNTGWVGK